MKLEFALLGRKFRNVNGQIDMIGGGWNTWEIPTLPGILKAELGMQLSFEPHEKGFEHNVSIRVVNSSNRPVGDGVEITLYIPVTKGTPGLPASFTHVHKFAGEPNRYAPVVIPESGIYFVEILNEDEMLFRRAFYVDVQSNTVQAPPSTSKQQAPTMPVIPESPAPLSPIKAKTPAWNLDPLKDDIKWN